MMWPPGRFVDALGPLFVGTLLLASPLMAATAYKETTGDLDLSRVRLVVAAPPHLAALLQDRALMRFRQAGFRLAGLETADAPLATLTLTLNPQPIAACPGMVLYAPSLTLTEPVAIARTGAVYLDATWIAGSDKEVAESIDSVRMEKDLDEFVSQFLTDYRAANTRRPSQMRAVSETSAQRQHPAVPVMHVSVLAGGVSPALKARAERQLAEAGFRTAATSSTDEVIDLSIELIQRPLEGLCPGQVLYERGIFVVEPVRVARSPRVTLWSDTWHEDSVRIMPPRSASALAEDQQTLLEGFIRTHTEWSAP